MTRFRDAAIEAVQRAIAHVIRSTSNPELALKGWMRRGGMAQKPNKDRIEVLGRAQWKRWYKAETKRQRQLRGRRQSCGKGLPAGAPRNLKREHVA